MREKLLNLLYQTGFFQCTLENLIMMLIGLILIYLAIKKGFEPLLLLPIGFGTLITNIPNNGLMSPPHDGEIGGLFWYIYKGIKYEIFPPIIFLGVGAWTDFSPLIANPKTFLLGAAAQFGIFATLLGAIYLGFSPAEAGAIGIIGGADGPTAIFTATKLAQDLLGPIAVAAYSYMALVPIIQPPIMRLLTTRKERVIVMENMREVSRLERIIFPIIVIILCLFIVPAASPLISMLMLGNLMRESRVVDRLAETIRTHLMNTVTIFLGLSVGMTMKAETFLKVSTIKILLLGIVAFSIATAAGVIMAKIMNLFSRKKINPLIGAAGVSAVPMSARVVQRVGQGENPQNFLLMHAMGPNVAGVIGSAVAAGVLLSILG